MTDKTYKDINLKYNEVCQFCKRHQVDEDGKCAWCAYDDFNKRQFEAECSRENPNFDDFYADGDLFV